MIFRLNILHNIFKNINVVCYYDFVYFGRASVFYVKHNKEVGFQTKIKIFYIILYLVYKHKIINNCKL